MQLYPKLSLYSKLSNKRKKYFKNLKWKLSSQIDSGVFVKIITRKFFWQKAPKNNELRNSGFVMKLKFPSYVTREFGDFSL